MLGGILDWIYPPKCALCERIGRAGICGSCLDEFKPPPAHFETPAGLDAIHAMYEYEGRVTQAIKALKYDRVTTIARFMSKQLADYAQEHSFFGCDWLVPIPMSPGRVRERGFNQAELLSESMPAEMALTGVLRRVRYTTPQVGLSRVLRLDNLKDAFSASDACQGKSVLLLDDVVTTGGTAAACAIALNGRGATSVKVLAFAGEPMRK